MTSIIVGQNISGSLTNTSPTIVDPTSPFNGQFYDDFDVSSVNVIDPNNLPFLLAASKELGDIGSVKIGEVRSTNIFIQPPAGSAPGASTVIQLINTSTNSIDAQATSSGSEALQFVKNAEIVGTDYKVRIINAIPGDYQISLAGAIQAVQVVGSGSTTGAVPPTPLIAVVNPIASNEPVPTLPTDVVLPVVLESVPTELIKTAVIDPIASTGLIPAIPVDVALPVVLESVPTELQVLTAVIDPPSDNQPTPIRNANPLPNERGVVLPDGSPAVVAIEPDAGEIIPLIESALTPKLNDGGTTTDPIINPSLIGIDPIIFQNAAGGIPTLLPMPAPPNPEIPVFPGMAPPVSLLDNLLLARFATGFSISAVSQKPGGKVSEIGIFAVDDATGKIGGIAPGAPGYLQAIGNSARSIFSTLGSSFFNSAIKREIAIDANKLYGFFEVQDGSIAEIKQQLLSGKTPSNILSSLPDANGIAPIKVTNNSTTGGYNVSINNDELVLNVVKLDSNIPNVPIGAKSQGLAEGRTIDLTGLTGTLKADITTKSSAAYNNNIGFYAVEDASGTIKLADGKTVRPGDVNYAVEAIKSALTNSLQAGKTASKLGQDITGGKIYAPVVVAQGSLSDFLATDPKNIGGGGINAYFNYVPANADKKDHFRLIGNNTFGVEDQFGGGDRDFNDLVVNMNIKPA